MTIGIALVSIFVLYLIDKHNRWQAVLKIAIGVGVISVLAVCGIYGWVKYDSFRREQQATICENRNANSSDAKAECEIDPSVTLQPTQTSADVLDQVAGQTEVHNQIAPDLITDPRSTGANAGETPANPAPRKTPTIDISAGIVGGTSAHPGRLGKAIMKRNTCDDLVVYDRETYGAGNPLVIDQLAAGATIQLLGHVTVGDEDIIHTSSGQKGFVSSGCLENIPSNEK